MKITRLASAALLALAALGLVGVAPAAASPTVRCEITSARLAPDLTGVSVTLTAGDTCAVSLASYETDGPTWPTSGVQRFVDHATVTLTPASPTATLSVAAPVCFGQVDLYKRATRYDGVEGPLPRFGVTSGIPNGLVDAWSGGHPCATPAPTPTVTPTPTPSPTPTVTPTPEPTPTVTVPPTTPPTTPAPTPTATTSTPTPTATSPAPVTPAPTTPTPTQPPRATPTPPTGTPTPTPTGTATPNPTPTPEQTTTPALDQPQRPSGGDSGRDELAHTGGAGTLALAGGGGLALLIGTILLATSRRLGMKVDQE